MKKYKIWKKKIQTFRKLKKIVISYSSEKKINQINIHSIEYKYPISTGVME